MRRGYPMVWRSSAMIRLWRQWRWLFVTAMLCWASMNPAVWLLIVLLSSFYLLNNRGKPFDKLGGEPVWLREDGSGFNAQGNQVQVMPPIIMFPGLSICRIQPDAFDTLSKPVPEIWLWRWRDQCEPATWARFCRILQHCREQSTVHEVSLLKRLSWVTLWGKNRR